MARPRSDGQPAREANKRTLTELFLQKPRREARTYLVWDLKQRNLAASISPSGTVSFKCIYSHHGRARWDGGVAGRYDPPSMDVEG